MLSLSTLRYWQNPCVADLIDVTIVNIDKTRPSAREARKAAGHRGYHHGNLREALLEQAVELARYGGPQAVVLRDVQRNAGVSNSAAYRHYADRDTLLAAVAEYVLQRLAERMIAAMNTVPATGPHRRRAAARLRATGQAYIDFAVAEPGLFRSAFAADVPASENPSSAHPFRVLAGCIDDLVATGVVSAARRDGLDAAAWAAVHGLAVLLVDGSLSGLGTAEKQQITDRLLDTFRDGLQ
jgi:AcrR family transcriptional regulator